MEESGYKTSGVCTELRINIWFIPFDSRVKHDGMNYEFHMNFICIIIINIYTFFIKYYCYNNYYYRTKEKF